MAAQKEMVGTAPRARADKDRVRTRPDLPCAHTGRGGIDKTPHSLTVHLPVKIGVFHPILQEAVMANHARIVPVLLGAAVLLGLHALPANAVTQITRTFVSNNGNDGDTCAADNPCLTLNGAYLKTLAGGEINILNGGDYGNLTIGKSITIRGEGNILGVTGGSNEIVVSAASSDIVNLVGLDILGGAEGILITSAGIVSIANCHFRDLSTAIGVSATTNIFVSVKDSLFQNNSNSIVTGASAVTAKVLIDNVTVFGIGATGSGTGIIASGSHASVVVNNSTIANNGTGLFATDGASLFTYGNNRVNFNGDNGQPNQPVLTMK
jgi:hypothetical protein